MISFLSDDILGMFKLPFLKDTENSNLFALLIFEKINCLDLDVFNQDIAA